MSLIKLHHHPRILGKEFWPNLLDKAVRVSFAPQQYVFYQGHASFGVYYFEKGKGLFLDEVQKNTKALELKRLVGLTSAYLGIKNPHALLTTSLVSGWFISINDLPLKEIILTG